MSKMCLDLADHDRRQLAKGPCATSRQDHQAGRVTTQNWRNDPYLGLSGLTNSSLQGFSWHGLKPARESGGSGWTMLDHEKQVFRSNHHEKQVKLSERIFF